MKRLVLAALIVVAFGLARYMLSTRMEAPEADRTSHAWQMRVAALSRARVFVAEAPRVASQPLDRNPRDRRPFAADKRLTCEYVPKRASGTTPKFDCRLPDGEVVKVKYGRTPEVHAEVAATRLLAALGFGADHVSFVHELECRGCPPAPYRTRQIAQLFFLGGLYDRLVDPQDRRVYRQVAVERKFEGQSIEVGEFEGWQWSELDLLRPELGAASRADVDALRLIAVLLGHWDNKASNQRLVCLDRPRKDEKKKDDDSSGGEPCVSSLVMLQDLGSTFGPSKLNLERWAETPVWTNVDRCLVSMRALPYDGATFVDTEISEEGRDTLAQRLRALSPEQIEDLFEGAAFPDPQAGRPTGVGSADVSAWVRTLQDKIRQVADRAPCPDHRSRGTSP